MHYRLSLLLTVLLLLAAVPSTIARSHAGTHLTLQVAAFQSTAEADAFLAQLARAGVQARAATVEVRGRGYWTRVFVGLFRSTEEARAYGNRLVGQGLIGEFLVRVAAAPYEPTRSRRVSSSSSVAPAAKGDTEPPPAESGELKPGGLGRSVPNKITPGKTRPGLVRIVESKTVEAPLPFLKKRMREAAPGVDVASIPRPDPVILALRLVTGREGLGYPQGFQGGLWLSGDRAEALERLRWIVGDENAGLIVLEGDGRVGVNNDLLARRSGVADSRAEDSVRVANYISSNEGLLLIAQLTNGRYRYCLHLGRVAPTHGKPFEISSTVNLDHNFDSRINPYRRNGSKLDSELPPAGFDSLVALNPAARWYNLVARSWVPAGEVTFHELAEAYGKLELGLDYLAHGSRPGAHALALDRERRLAAQRPAARIVSTAGSNRVLRNQEEIRLFLAESVGGTGQR